VLHRDKPLLRSLGPRRLVGSDADILIDRHALRNPLAGLEAEQFAADRPVHDVDLVLGGTLASVHPDFAVRPLREGGDRDEPLAGAVGAADQVAAEAACRPDPDFGRTERPQLVEVLDDGGGFFLGICEDARVEPEFAAGFAGQE